MADGSVNWPDGASNLAGSAHQFAPPRVPQPDQAELHQNDGGGLRYCYYGTTGKYSKDVAVVTGGIYAVSLKTGGIWPEIYNSPAICKC